MVSQVNYQSPVNWAHPLNRGLVSWFKVLPQRRGSLVWRDLCRRNDLDLDGGMTPASWVSSYGRSSLILDGTANFLTPGTIDQYIPDLQGAFSVGFWVRTSLGDAGNRAAFGCSYSAGPYWYMAIEQNSSRGVYCNFRSDSSNTTSFSTTTKINDAIWHYVFVTKTGVLASGINLYIDGINQSLNVHADATPNAMNESQNWSIGGRNTAPSTVASLLPGEIDDFRIYDHKVSKARAVAYYHLSRTGYGHLLNRVEMSLGYEAAVPIIPDEPGLRYTIPGERPFYTIPGNQPRYTIPDQRPLYTIEIG